MASPVSLWLVVLAVAAGGCRRAAAPAPATAPSAPQVWIESEPGPNTALSEASDASGWAGVWLEHFPGRPDCQDRFTLMVDKHSMAIESIDCTNGLPYDIFEIGWDGEVLHFVASPPDSAVELSYTLELRGPGQIVGTANGTAITWSRASH